MCRYVVLFGCFGGAGARVVESTHPACISNQLGGLNLIGAVITKPEVAMC